MVSVGISSSIFSSLIGQNSTVRQLSEQSAVVTTGLRVNTADDDIFAFVQNVNLGIDASSLFNTQAPLDSALTRVDAAITALESIVTAATDARAIAESVVSTGTSTAALQAAFDALEADFAVLQGLGSVSGSNLLATAGATNNVTLVNVIGLNTNIQITSAAITANITAAIAQDVTDSTNAAAAVGLLDTFLTQLNTNLATLGVERSLLETSSAANSDLQTLVEAQATALVEYDAAQDSARLTALTTQQDVGLTVIGLISSSQRSVLALFQ